MSANGDHKALRVWVLTDGKIGDNVQCTGVAAGLTRKFEKRVIKPHAPWEWMAPWGPIDPRDAPTQKASPIKPPFPDVLIASGRRAIPYAKAIKKASGGKTFVVMMKNPRVNPRHADLIWAPSHDRLDGENVMTTLTSPHALALSLPKVREAPIPVIAKLPKPMLGVVLGGPSGGARYDSDGAARLSKKILEAKKDYGSVAITPSRRTPAAFLTLLREAVSDRDVFVWDGEGPNPYNDILAHAAALIIAADSHNMMSEAAATQTGVYAWRPNGLAKKLSWFVGELEELGAVRMMGEQKIEPFLAAPIDATAAIVAEIRARLGASAGAGPANI